MTTAERQHTPTVEESPVLVSRIEQRDREPDLCTIYPPDTEGMERMTTWMTASEGSYVDLEDAR